MPLTQAHPYEADQTGLDALVRGEGPILLADIDRVLDESACVGHACATAVRSWREDLTLAQECLAYARSVLASDVGILRHCLADAGSGPEALLADLPAAMAGGEWGDAGSEDTGSEAGVSDLSSTMLHQVFARSDALMSAHDEMAHTDLTSPEEVRRLLDAVHDQLHALEQRQNAVAARLQQIRAAIVRLYHEGSLPAPNPRG